MLKVLRSGKVTINTEDCDDTTLDAYGNVNNTLQNFMDERNRMHQIRPSSPISPKSYDNTKERLSFVDEVVQAENKDVDERTNKSPPLEFIEEEFHLTKSTE